MNSAVVTGVSTGIGAAVATELIAAGWQVFGSVRRESDGMAAKARLGKSFHPLVFDTTDEPAVVAAAEMVRSQLAGGALHGLVNNAGIALADPLIVQPTDDFRRQIDVNLVGPFIVTRAFAPLLGAREDAPPGRGRIVNISSVAGAIGSPFLGAYVASKHGLEGMSASLRRELQIFGVDVVIVAPGFVATPIWDKGEQRGLEHLRGTVWEKPATKFGDLMMRDGRKGASPEAIGQIVVRALTARNPKARYAPVVGKFKNWMLPTLLPARLLDKLIGQRFGLRHSRGNDARQIR
jgi:NAD(P)-dependent dehydrogenase (short-subunit alcohol dehydrogenase family)